MVDHEPPPSRVFRIMEKTPYETIRDNPRLSGLTNQLNQEIITNARELEAGVDWSEILRLVDWSFPFVLPIVSMVKAKELHMHSPEVVYMSGYHMVRMLTRRLALLDNNVANATKRTFASEEQKEETLQKERKEASRLGTYKKRINTSLEEYARQHLPQDAEYLTVLQELPYASQKIRNDALKLFKNDQVSEAATVLLANKKNRS